MHRTRLAAIAFGAAAVVGVAGCGGGSGGLYGSSNNNSSNTPSSTSSGVSSGASKVEVNSTSLGKVVTDGAGRTLYMYTPDPKNQSVCDGSCAAAWPPMQGKPTAGTGADAALVGSIKRSDGSPQGTYAGHPLYYYAGDSVAGDVIGQGIQNIWWVLDAHGQPIQTMASSSSGGSGGY